MTALRDAAWIPPCGSDPSQHESQFVDGSWWCSICGAENHHPAAPPVARWDIATFEATP